MLSSPAQSDDNAGEHDLTLDFWVGEVGRNEPLYTGPQQFPFICGSSESGLGQPLVDNFEGLGHPVFEVEGDTTSTIVGYSTKCGVPTRVDYFYLATDGNFRLYDKANPASSVHQIPVNGQLVDFIVRVETGTLNKFLYTIAMLAPFGEQTTTPEQLNNQAWNGNLLYYFRGGVGIGHWQGQAAWSGGLWGAERAIFPQMLAAGYAIATSSGNETGVHYNMRLAEEIAFMVTEHFEEIYGEPGYTIGIGGSV